LYLDTDDYSGGQMYGFLGVAAAGQHGFEKHSGAAGLSAVVLAALRAAASIPNANKLKSKICGQSSSGSD